MDTQAFPIYLKQGVRAFNLRFCNSYHFKQFKALVKQLGYTLQEVTPGDEKNSQGKPKFSAGDMMLEKASRAQLFKKIIFYCKYESDTWAKLKKAKLSSPCVMVTDSLQVKTAELWEGPSDGQIVEEIKNRLIQSGIRYNTDAWNLLLKFNTDKDNHLTDPEGLWNAAFSIGIQAGETVDIELARNCLGRTAQGYDLLDNLLIKNVGASLQCINILVNEEESINLCQGLQTMLNNHLGAYEAWERKEPLDKFTARMGLNPFYAKKMYEKVAKIPRINFLRLRDALLSADILMKTTRKISNSETFKNEMLKYLNI